jgi:3-hydroxy-9,10-secoandrosta-1,3,5(10)-triene-9,17-dione monooxygenase reductase component
MTAIGSRGLRDVLGCYATGVAIITTRTTAGEHTAVTVNSFSSLSLDPPLILFSLGKQANILAHFQQAQTFAVNVLAHTQESLSNLFARPSTASWETTPYSEGENGCALFAGALAQLECSRYAEIDGGDHRTFFGQVTQIHLGDPGDPLLFYRGRYGTYARSQFDKLPVQDGSLSDFSVIGWS